MSEINPARGDHFDRIIGSLHGLPDVLESRPSTVTTTLPMLGLSKTFVVQTYKQKEHGFTIFVQSIDSEDKVRLVLPPKVALAIFRQVDALVKKAKKQATAQALETRRRKLSADSGDGPEDLKALFRLG